MNVGLVLESIKAAAERLGIKEATLRKWIYQGRVGAVRLGRAVRVRRDEIDTLIDRSYRGPRVEV